MVKKLSLLLTLVFFLDSATVIAKSGEKTDTKTEEYKTFEGTLVCQSCDLKKNEGARAACSVYAHKHALKTDDVNILTY